MKLYQDYINFNSIKTEIKKKETKIYDVGWFRG